ncbi:MAG TPA: YbhB/YbcL family Raf kinase inhibitor-like protein [Polyangiaceae bacterium]|jgi:phosphatidylethanolamine-binding protein (PEBP) family uncharacterized protein|nr:YbhB/YbcL family Raf kinase inhibitor-like protein [Polyangiaceae bacterium]
MRSPILSRVLPALIAFGIPSAIVGCSSGDDDTSNNAGSGGTGASGGTGSGGTSAGQSSGGTTTTGGAGGSVASGGTGGAMTTGGSAGRSMAGGGGKASGGSGGGSAGQATGGSAGAGTGGASTGGTSSGGASTGGATSGGMGAGGAAAGSGGTAMGGAGGAMTGGTFTLASTDQMDGAKFAGTFTCNGGSLGSGVNPELHWSGSPAGAMSFAITFIDTTLGADNSMGQHWAMYNIPASVMEIAQGALTKTLTGDIMAAKQVTPLNNGFLAPCASSMAGAPDDNYEFTVYALNTASLTNPGTSVKSVLQALGVLDSAGKLVNPPMLNAAVLGTAVLHGHAGSKGK